MRPIARLALPLARSYSSNRIPYKTEATHSGVNLTETTPSYRVDQSTSLTDTSVKHSVFNERRVRAQLQQLGGGGSVNLHKDNETGIAKIVISNPEKGNAVTGGMMVDLADIVQDLAAWHSGKGVILCSDPAGQHFCSGGDVSVLRGLQRPQDGGTMCFFMQNTLGRLQSLPLISAALVTGQAIGGGWELTTACDFRLLRDDASVTFKQAKLGLSTGWGGGSRLVHIVGSGKALRLLAGSQTISAEEALRIGLADEVLPSDGNIDPVHQATEWLERYTRPSVDIVHGIKNLVNAAALLPLDKALKVEREIFRGLWFSPEHEAKFAKLLKQLKEKK